MPRWSGVLVLSLMPLWFSAPSGCGAARRPEVVEPIGPQPPAEARPARSLDEEATPADRVGQVLVVVLAVGMTFAMIVLPLSLL